MKAMKKTLCVLAVLVLVFTLSVSALAAYTPTTYTIRVYAGNQGTIAGGTVYEFSPKGYGDEVNLNDAVSQVQLKNPGKYYIKGVHEAGHDSEENLSRVAFSVKEDADYVVAYGIKGETVTLTVRYRDIATGDDIADPTYYNCNAGDRPVVPYQYIDDYILAPTVTENGVTRSQGYNITGTVNENTEWTFWYNSAAAVAAAQQAAQQQAAQQQAATTTTTAQTTTTTTTTTTTANANTTTAAAGEANATAAEGNAAANAATTTNAQTTTANAPAANEQPAANEPAAANNEQPAANEPAAANNGQPAANEPAPELPTEPEEIIDMDTPLANFPGAEDGKDEAKPEPETTSAPGEPIQAKRGLSRGAIIAIAAGVVVVACGTTGGIIYLRGKKDSEDIY